MEFDLYPRPFTTDDGANTNTPVKLPEQRWGAKVVVSFTLDLPDHEQGQGGVPAIEILFHAFDSIQERFFGESITVEGLDISEV